MDILKRDMTMKRKQKRSDDGIQPLKQWKPGSRVHKSKKLKESATGNMRAKIKMLKFRNGIEKAFIIKNEHPNIKTKTTNSECYDRSPARLAASSCS